MRRSVSGLFSLPPYLLLLFSYLFDLAQHATVLSSVSSRAFAALSRRRRERLLSSFESVRPSVCPSVRPSAILSALRSSALARWLAQLSSSLTRRTLAASSRHFGSQRVDWAAKAEAEAIAAEEAKAMQQVRAAPLRTTGSYTTESERAGLALARDSGR